MIIKKLQIYFFSEKVIIGEQCFVISEFDCFLIVFVRGVRFPLYLFFCNFFLIFCLNYRNMIHLQF